MIHSTTLTDFLMHDSVSYAVGTTGWRRLVRGLIIADLGNTPSIIRCFPSRSVPGTIRVIGLRGPAAVRFGVALRDYRKMLEGAGL